MTGLRHTPVPTTSPVTVRVPAKVNLQLSVGPRRRDGYHDLVSVFHAVAIYDEVVVSENVAGAGITLRIEGECDGRRPHGPDATSRGPPPSWPPGPRVSSPTCTSSCARGFPSRAAWPVAAATRLPPSGCDALWRTGLDRVALSRLAAELGSDVTFSLHGGTAVGTGRGEQLTPALARGQFHWVFAFAEEGLSTARVYAECDRLRGDTPVLEPRVNDLLMAALRSGDAAALGRTLTNDLQRAALLLRPQLNLVLEVGNDHGALGSVVSGSGPTCAFLVADDEAALDVAVALTASGVCRTVKRAVGPVPGARVVEGPGAR